MHKHTPAPWVFSDNSANWKTNPYSITCRGKSGVHSTTIANIPARASFADVERRANAMLIAAAPELLEALEEIIRGVPDTWDGVQKAKTALAKAKEQA